jgi:hypothetical protein
MVSELPLQARISDIDFYLSVLDLGAAEVAEPLVAPINLLRRFGDEISNPHTSASSGPVRRSWRLQEEVQMKRVTSFLYLIMAVGCAPLAHAALQLSFQISGGTQTVCATSTVETGPLTCPSITGSGVTITNFSAQTNAPGGPTESHEFGSTLEITNTSTPSVLVILWLSAQNFTFPTVPPGTITFDSEVALTSTSGTGSVGLESCVDTSNGLAPPTTAFCSAGPSLINVSQGYSGASSEQNTKSTPITSLKAPFSLSQEITLTLNRNSNLNVDTSAILTPSTVPPPIPEPASIALLGGAMLFTAAGGRLFRRKR